MVKPKFDLSLYLVTDRPLANGRDISWIVLEAVKGGATLVQLREKDCPTDEFISIAKDLKAALKPYGIPLIINDRIDVALAVDADGVHIGHADMPFDMARKLLGEDKIIGLSTDNMDEVIAANDLDVDYIGISPVYGTPTKTDTSAPFGIKGLEKAFSLSKHRMCAIGGMNASTIGDVIKTGCEGVAVVSAIVAAESPRAACEELSKIIKENRPKWSATAWNSSVDIVEEIYKNHFVDELCRGTLPQDDFTRYIQQDKIYVANYGSEVELLCATVADEKLRDTLRTLGLGGAEDEQAMQAELSLKMSIADEENVAPVNREYMDFILSQLDTKDSALALAAMLPCPWVYREVGKYIIQRSTLENHPYADWIAMYSSPDMDKISQGMIDAADELAETADQEKQHRMRLNFADACKYELRFFDEACKGPHYVPPVQHSYHHSPPKKHYSRVLTIAGSDSGGGAGIQADIKAISANGCFAASAITAVTAQNTLGVVDVAGIPIDILEKQIEAVLSDIGADAVKIGMLHSAECVQCVAKMIAKFGVKNVVLDPVMVSTSGHTLIEDSAIEVLKTALIPLARVITPNIPEAEVLLGRKLPTQEELPAAARELAKQYNVSVLLKAGHLVDAELVDIFYNVEDDELVELKAPRIQTPNTHGTGCTLSSALAAHLAKGKTLTAAATLAKAYLHDALLHGKAYEIGKGHGPVHHFYNLH